MIRDLNNSSMRASDAELDAALAAQEGQFSRGIRSGTLGLGADISNAAGAIGNSLGFDQFGQQAYATADDLKQQAQAAAPRVTSVRDVRNLNDAADWAAGTLGGVVPSAALGIGAGMMAPAGLVGGLAAGTAAYTLPEMGDVVGRMREQGQPVDTGKALGVGALSAAGQSIVPAIVGGKLVGKTVSAAPMSLRQAGRTLATETALEAGSEGGSEAGKQLATGKTLDTLDWGQVIDNAAAGGVGGLGMSGLGVTGEYAHSNASRVSDGLTSAKAKLSGAEKAAQPLIDSAESSIDRAKAAGQDYFDTLHDLYDDGKTKAKDVLNKIVNSEDIIGDARAFAGAQGDKLKTMLAGDDNERINTVKQYVDELTAKNLSPENKAVLDDWLATPGDHAKQAAVAALKQTFDAAKEFGAKAGDFLNEMKFRKGSGGDGEVVDMSQPTPNVSQIGGPKKSEDFGGARAAIMKEVVPVLMKARPELAQNVDQNTLMKVGDGLRMLVGELTSGKQPSSNTVASLMDLFGPQMTDVVEAAHRAVGDMSDKKGTAAFFKSLNNMVDAQRNRNDLVGTLRSNLKPEFQKRVSDAELAVEGRMLEKWASDSRKRSDDPEFLYRDSKARAALAARYSDPDVVMAAIEAQRKKVQNMLADESRAGLSESDEIGVEPEDSLDGPNDGIREKSTSESNDVIKFFGKNQELFEDPTGKESKVAKDGKTYPHATVQALERAKTMYPNMSVQFRPAAELGMDHPAVVKRLETVSEQLRKEGMSAKDAQAMAKEAVSRYGYITAEGSKQETRISKDELKLVQFQADPKTGKVPTSHYNSPSAIKTSEAANAPVIDAVRLTNFMEARMQGADNRTEFDNKGAKYRKARMFKEGIAAVQEQLRASFDIPDSTVISLSGGKNGGLTWGEVKNLAEIGPGLDELRGKAAAARKEFETLTAGRPMLKNGKLGFYPKGSEAAKRLYGSEKDIERFTELADREESRVLMDKASQSDGGRPSNKTIEKLIAEASNENVAKLLEERLVGRKDNNSNEDQVEIGFEANEGLPLGKPDLRRLEAALMSVDNSTPQGRVREQELLNQISELNVKNGGQDVNVGPELRMVRKKIAATEERISISSNPAEREMLRTSVSKLEERLQKLEAADQKSMKGDTQVSGVMESDPFGNVSEALGGGNDKNGVIRTNLTGLPRTQDTVGTTPPAASTKRSDWAPWANDVLRENKLADSLAALKELDVKQLQGLNRYLQSLDTPPNGVTGLRLKQMQAQVSAKLAAIETSSGGQGRGLKNAEGTTSREQPWSKTAVQLDLGSEDFGLQKPAGAPPGPKVVAAKKAALLEAASSGDKTLLQELGTSDNASGLQRALDTLVKAIVPDPHTRSYASYVFEQFPGGQQLLAKIRQAAARGDVKELNNLRREVSEKITEHGANEGYAPEVIEADIAQVQRFVDRDLARKIPETFKKNARDYIDTVLGKDAVDLLFSTTELDGYNAMGTHGSHNGRETITLPSKFTESPFEVRSTVYHESAHALFARLLNDKRFENSVEALINVAQSKEILTQLDKIYANEPAVRDYYKSNPEEGVAYMYQHWAEGRLTITDKPTLTIFEKIKAFLNDFLNALSDKNHVQALFEMYKSGKLKDEIKPLTHDDLIAARNFSMQMGFIKYSGGQTNLMRVADTAHDRLAELVRSDETVAYELSTKKYSAQQTNPNNTGPQDRQAVYDHIMKTLGPDVQVAWKNFLHAGEFERVVDKTGAYQDIIRLSVHSLNPLSTAYHESLHAFFERLRDMKHGPAIDVLEKAASSAPVLSQLKKLLTNEPAALEQLKNPEERAAYMYQFWASGQLTVGNQTRSFFQRIADFVRSALGIWSNDQRALHIMEYFHQGDFAKDSAKSFARDVVGEKIFAPGRNNAIETAKRMTQPFRELGEALAVAGGQRLRDTGIPALRELADAMKLHDTNEGADAGFLPAARAERTRVMNDLGAKLKGMAPEAMNAAMESLQTKSNDAIKALADPQARLDARKAKEHIRDTLDKMFHYMRAAGVDVNDLGVGKDYFPRQYDVSFISSHQQEFKSVLAQNGVSNPDSVMKKIMVSEGAEFMIESDKPGMQHLKPRELAFIPDAELAPFMRKNLFEIMNGYITQATRRAEWASRFGDKSERIAALLEQAQREGATPEQIRAGQNFVRSVDGTLGDTINPEARRLIGNMIVYQNIRLLPLAIFSSVVDPLGIVVRGGTVSEAFSTFKRGVSEVVKNFKRGATDDDMTKLAASIGTIDDSSLVHTLGALYSQGMVGDTSRKINDTFFRYNLMEQFNTSMRVGATEAALNFLVRHNDGTASKHSKRWLNELGLDVGSVKLDANGRPDVSDPQIKMAVNRWVDGAVLRPDAVDKPIWMSDPHFALIAHLKQFVYSFNETILKRVGHEFDHGNYAPAMALASYVPMMIAADLVKGLIQGGGDQPDWKKDWTLWDYTQSGIERGGLLGTGQFAMDAFKDVREGGSGIGALAGPTVEQLTDAARVIGGRAEFGSFALKSMPANALYAHSLGGQATDPKFAD